MYCNTGAMPPGMELETPEKFNKSNEYPEDTNDTYWHEVVEEIYKFTGKYKEIGLAEKLAQALIADLEERR